MIFAKRALLPSGWVGNVRVTVDGGRIASVTAGAAPAAGDARVDTLLPALANLHSHAFQRAMAGMTEYRAAGRESFWTWRDLMYRFLDRLTPEQVEAIAAQVQVEMLEAGFASVGEFHYVHHQPGGAPYRDIAELSSRIMAAAAETGIGLTHLPVLYSYGGAGQAPLQGGQLARQRRGAVRPACRRCARCGARPARDTVVGIAPYGCARPAPKIWLWALPIAGDLPVHIHVAEQPRRWPTSLPGWGAAGRMASGQRAGGRPLVPDPRHPHDRDGNCGAGASGAVAGLCPITEANLGDGPFNGPQWIAAGGAFGLGSDLNVRISLTEEPQDARSATPARSCAQRDGAGCRIGGGVS